MGACHCVNHVCRLGQVTDDDLGAEFAQRMRSGVVVVNQRAHPVPACAQQLNHLSADTTGAAAGAGLAACLSSRASENHGNSA